MLYWILIAWVILCIPICSAIGHWLHHQKNLQSRAADVRHRLLDHYLESDLDIHKWGKPADA